MADTRDNDSKTAATGVGAVIGGAAGGVAGGAAAGAAVGGMTGPVGAAVGAAVGAVVGAVAGRSVTKADPAVEDAYWRDNYSGRPYIASDATFDDYGPAYRHGVEAYSRNPNRSFDDAETELSRDWGTARGSSRLDWERAKHASRDAWDRLSNSVERAIPGDSDRDGR
ncbi:glycine zipper domain-containing protein [Variovorax sp. UMC13]|uniref:glycine zipper domain-containing protein n=1 Tax=Variovorax sp. UMC13 TaxID=1862326 RepID=UPI00160070E2|nr:glycine zipper domain-containing protein [Variovorax sp. UMC13]